MKLTCYVCHQDVNLQGWNPLHEFFRCVVCGRAIYVGLAIERVHGTKIGKEAKDLIEGLGRVARKGRTSVAHLVELTLHRLEWLLGQAEKVEELCQQLPASRGYIKALAEERR